MRGHGLKLQLFPIKAFAIVIFTAINKIFLKCHCVTISYLFESD